jgi:hypothetical protein
LGTETRPSIEPVTVGDKEDEIHLRERFSKMIRALKSFIVASPAAGEGDDSIARLRKTFGIGKRKRRILQFCQ